MWIFEQICIGSSATALVTYLLSKVRCICKNPCSCDTALCIYGSNESSYNHISDDDNEVIITSAKNIKPNICY